MPSVNRFRLDVSRGWAETNSLGNFPASDKALLFSLITTEQRPEKNYVNRTTKVTYGNFSQLYDH